MSNNHDIRKFSVTERVNDDNSEYFNEIRRSRSLTRKPVGYRPQSLDYDRYENKEIKDVSLENTSSLRKQKYNHHHKSNSNKNNQRKKPSKTSLLIKKNHKSSSIRRELIDKNDKSNTNSYVLSERPSSSHQRKRKEKENSKYNNNHGYNSKRSFVLSPAEKYYDEDNFIINYNEDKNKYRSNSRYNNKDNNNLLNISRNRKHDHSSHHSRESDNVNEVFKENIISLNIKKEKNNNNKIKIENDNERNKGNKEYNDSIISQDSNFRGSNSSIVLTHPRPLNLAKTKLRYSKIQLDNEISYGIPLRSSDVSSSNRSLSRTRSVPLSNQVSVYSNDSDNTNQPKNRLSSSYNELPLYKSNESIRELRQNMLRKYSSSEIISLPKSEFDNKKSNHTLVKRSVSSNTSKLRHSLKKEKNNDMGEIKRLKKYRLHSLSVSENKSEDRKKKNKDKKIKSDKKIKENKEKKGNNKSNEEREEKIPHSENLSESRDQETSSKMEKKINRYANIPAPIPDESLKWKKVNIHEKEESEDDQDLAIKPVMPIIETPINKRENKDTIIYYPEGYTPSIDDSVKTKINEDIEEDINPEKEILKINEDIEEDINPEKEILKINEDIEEDINPEKEILKKAKSKSHSNNRSRHHQKSRSRSKSKSKNRKDYIDENNENIIKEDHKKHSRKHKSKRLSDENSTIIEKLDEYPYENNIFENLKKKPEDFKNSNICIHIYRTDALELNIKNVHPLVKVHVVDISTEKYLTKSSALRPATSFYENSEVGYIMPILTKPYYLQKNHTNISRWNQGLYINEDYLHVVRKNVIIFFEIMDFIEKAEDRKKNKDGWHRIAWAFLKLVGTHDMTNTEHTRRLQLYKYPKKLIKNKDPKKPEVIEYWKKKLVKYQSTLFVKVYSQKIPETKEVSYRPKMPNEKEIGTLSYNQLMDMYKTKKKILDPVYKSFINFSQKPSWRREDGQLCKIPNHLHFRIDGGERGCLAAEYSHLGYLFALTNTSLNSVTTIKIFDTVSGDKIASLKGHQDLVYDIKWSHDDKHLFSASADCSVRSWSFQSETFIRSSTIFQHPCYVYCIQIHPIIGQDNKITVITGSYDGKIRFWKYDQNLYNNIEISKQAQIHHQTQFLPAYVLTGHESTINSLAIESSGIRLFSADGKGIIRVWSCRVNDSIGYDNYKCIKVIPTQSDPINCIRLHPNERQLLVHCLGNTIYMVDIRFFKVLTCITTLPSNQYPIKSILSPCGTYIFSGSTDGQVYVWNSMTGKLVAKYENLTISQPIMGIVYHPLDDYISFYTYGPEQPVLTFTWDNNYKPLESLLKIENLEEKKLSKIFNLTSNKIIDEEKKFPFSNFKKIEKNEEDNLDLPEGLRNKQGFRQFDEPFKSKPVFI